MYRIKAENFLLEFSLTVYEDDFSYPVNTTLSVEVSSFGFAANSFMDIGIQGLSAFAIQLNEMYDTLTGSAELYEPYGISFIKLSASRTGHIKIWGRINNKSAYGFEQELTFENEIDQTYLRDFAKALFNDYGKTC